MAITIEETRLIQKLNKFEIQCVTGNFTAEDFQIDEDSYQFSNKYKLIKDFNVLMRDISNHEYKKALQTDSEFFKPFKNMCKDLTLVFNEMYSQMKSNNQYLFHVSNDDCPYVKQLILLLVGVSALQEFVKVNICGPAVPDSSLQEICASFLPDSHFTDESVLSALGQNGEVILNDIYLPKLLFLSLMLLFGNNFDKCLTHKWWLSRCMMVHQKILSDSSLSLYKSIRSLIHSQAEISFLHDKSEPLAAFMFNCECAQFFLLYDELNVAERYIVNAQNILGLGIKLSNYCRRSSYWDDCEISEDQNCVVVRRNDKRYNSDLIVYNDCTFPIDCTLAFEKRSDHKMVILDHDRKKINELSPEEQVVLLLYCHLLMSKRCDNEMSYINATLILDYLTSKPKIWSLQMKALILKCLGKRYIHSGHISQVNQLIFHVENELSIFSHKLVLFYCTSLPMIYNLYKIQADVLFCTGRTKEEIKDALDIYSDFNLWKGANNCWKRLNDISAGVLILQMFIDIKPSPVLWCFLGHLREDVEDYQVAWDLSGHSNARAARYMGYYYFKHKMYDTSIFHLKESLKLNSLQPKALFCLGLAAIACRDFDTAIEAFIGILEMNADNCDAWIHLCKAYIEVDDEVNASRCFLEIMTFDKKTLDKTGRKFWRNYLMISVKIRAFSDAISGFHYYLDDKFAGLHLYPNGNSYSKYLSSTDIEVLKILVNAIKNDIPELHHASSLKLKRKAIKLFQRITSKKCHYPIIWELYSVLLCIRADFHNNMHNTKNVLACQQKAIKHYFKRLHKFNGSFEPLLKLLLKCSNLFDIYATNFRCTDVEKFNFNKFQLFLVNAVRRMKSFQVSPLDRDLLNEIEQKFAKYM